MKGFTGRGVTVAGLVWIGLSVTPAPAGAGPFTLFPPTVVSPLGSCGGVTLTSFSESHASVAVNPADPQEILGVFEQALEHRERSHGSIVAARSEDAGTTWNEEFIEGHFACVSDAGEGTPWVTFDAAGDAYVIDVSSGAIRGVGSDILLWRSADGGPWIGPTPLFEGIGDGLDSDFSFNLRPSITGDPTRPGYVYAVWSSFPQMEPGRALFSRTTNAGADWSPPVAITSQTGNQANQIAVLPNGDLIDVVSQLRRDGRAAFQAAMVSTDAGVSWSPPIPIERMFATVFSDPDTGRTLYATSFPDVAVDRQDGTIYVVWADGRFSGGRGGDVVITRSSTGGRTWSRPTKVNQTPIAGAAFTPSVEVSADGTVAVTYYDFRNNTPDAGLPTDVWLAHSHDRGETWSEQHLAGPFDLESAPPLGIGAYQGLAAVGRDFVPFFVKTNDGDTANPTDVIAMRAVAP